MSAGGDAYILSSGDIKLTGMSTSRDTVLSSLTSGGTADIKVKGNTQITGALIATLDAEGNDTQQLNLQTGTLHSTDLHNTTINNQTSAGLSSHFAMGEAKPDQNPRAGQTLAEGANGETLHARTSNLTYNNEQTNSGSKTLATLGHGNIVVGGTQLEQNGQLTDAGKATDSPLILLNRDTTTTEKTLWNSKQSQTVDATLDHRLVTKDGQNQIREDVKRTEIGVESVANLAEQSVSLLGKGEGETSLRQHLQDSQDYFTATKKFASDPNNKNYIDVINSGTGTPEQKDAAYTALASSIAAEMGVDVVKAKTLVQDHYNLTTKTYDGTSIQQQIQGAYAADPTAASGKKDGVVYMVDDNIANTSDAVDTLGHETSHHVDANRDSNAVKTQTYQDNRENYADMMGAATVDYLSFNFASNNYATPGAVNLHTDATTSNSTVRQNNAAFNAVDQSRVDYRQLDIPEIHYVRDEDRVERFANYIKSTTGEELTTKQAQARLLQGSAGLMDGKWQERYGTDAKVMDFLTTEIATDIKAVNNNHPSNATGEMTELQTQQRLLNSDLAYVDPKTGDKRLVFALHEGEYTNERDGVVNFMSNQTLGLIDDLGVAKTEQQRLNDYWTGFSQGQRAAVDNPVGVTWDAITGTAKGIYNLATNPIDTTVNAWQGVKETGAYDNLLRFSGRDESRGYINGYQDGATAVAAVAAPVMEFAGGSLLQAAYARANGGVATITADAKGQVAGIAIQERSTSPGWDTVGSQADGDFGYLNQTQVDPALKYPIIETPYGAAIQSTSPAALAVRESVENGAPLNRGGSLGVSHAADGQFWSTDNPLSIGYAERNGIPAENYPPDFVCTGYLCEGAPFITREAPGVGLNNGGAIEIVTPPGAVKLDSFHMPEKLLDENTLIRPSSKTSEIDIGNGLDTTWRAQVSFKNGKEVPYGTSGSVRPDWCDGTACSIEVKNYNIDKNMNGLINNISKQAVDRELNLPQGMEQKIVIDIRGQNVSAKQEDAIVRGLVDKSNKIINPENIEFKRK